MRTFTSSLPADLLLKLQEASDKFSVPKNKIIEKALRIYLEQLSRAEYIQSFKEMSDDADILLIAEEGMADYIRQTES